ncbi:receptor-like protein kinase HSL1 [Gossypium australe]|uniref:Receptor-like protein kinase HSL1 n=1 Tax=Gossypium australe TaxID=47621 RepID=A0A5B6W5N6_9ROSI|nr:receptor-like protein kinase HSL1 [Gossypium australe]
MTSSKHWSTRTLQATENPIFGDVVAVKKLWSRTTKDSTSDDQFIIKKCLNTEVETLGNIRHKNRIKLYSYFSNFDCHLLFTTTCRMETFGMLFIKDGSI